MANLPEFSEWTAGIYQLETTDPVEGGAEGIDNLQAKQLANRTKYLQGLVTGLTSGKQPLDQTLTALAALISAADQMIYATGADTFAMTPLTAFARTLLSGANAANMRTTLGLSVEQTYFQAYSLVLTRIAALATAADKMIYTTAADTYAVTALTAFARSILDDADAATARTTLGLGTVATLTADTDAALAANSDSRIATQKAIKAYVDGRIAANDAMVFKGGIDCSASPNYPAADCGFTYRVTVAGKIGGAAGPAVEVGDALICGVDGSIAGTQATVGANWIIIQSNLDGALTIANIGTTVQGYDATLAALAALATAADQMIYATGADTFATTPLTAVARTLLSGANAANMRTTLGLSAEQGYIQPYHLALVSIAALVTAADKMIYTTAANTYAVTALTAFARSILDDADAATARTTLGIVPADTNTAGLVELATAAETVAGTLGNVAVTPYTLRTMMNINGSAPVFPVRAWVNFNGTGTLAVLWSANVSSVTDNGTGDYTVNFATAMPHAYYSCNVSSSLDEDGYLMNELVRAEMLTTSCRVHCRKAYNVPADRSVVCVSIIC